MEWLWTVGGFLLGSIPFSWLIGRVFLHQDIRCIGDGNPGAANL
jgi:glycerol-3-phosphate acyltransferase PlsY